MKEYQITNKSEKVKPHTKKSSIVILLLAFFFIGAVLGVVSKILDIYTTNIGNMFSELSIWILFGVLISIYSKKPGQAALNVFVFCVGMLLTYYTTAHFTNSVYSKTFIYGWSIFTLFSPLFAFITWYSKKNNILSKFISVGIISVTILSAIIFDGLRIRDYIIILFLIYFLFIKKVK